MKKFEIPELTIIYFEGELDTLIPSGPDEDEFPNTDVP